MPNRNALIRSRLDTVPTADDFPYTLTSGPSLTTSQLLDNLSIGMGYGATNQLKGTWDMVAHPINALKGIGSLAKQAVTQPNKLAAALMAYGKQGVTSGPLEFGRFVGENLSLRRPGGVPMKRDIVSAANLKTEILAKLDELRKQNPYRNYGVRVIGPQQAADIGTRLTRSSKWVDGRPLTTKLPGTAVFDMRYGGENLDRALDAALAYNLGKKGQRIAIVAADEVAPHTMPEGFSALLKSPTVEWVADRPADLDGVFHSSELPWRKPRLRTPGRLPTDRVDMLPPSLRKRLADATRYNDRNPRKLANEMVRAGTVPAELRDEIAGALTDIRATRQFRRENRPLRVDPLQQNAIHRAEKAKALSSVKSFDSLPPSADWASNRAETVRSLAAAGRIDDAFDEATKATLEAITRKARAQGLTVRHTSTGRDGRVSSRYITLPDGREVRISDHHIPLTPEREFNRAISGNQPWSREIIVSARDGKTIGDYLREILE